MVNVTRVKIMPKKNHNREVSNLFFRKCRRAPANKTNANTSKPAATIKAVSAIMGESSPADAKNFWN